MYNHRYIGIVTVVNSERNVNTSTFMSDDIDVVCEDVALHYENATSDKSNIGVGVHMSYDKGVTFHDHTPAFTAISKIFFKLFGV